MLFLGLILLTVSGAFTGLLIADNLNNGPSDQVTVLGSDIGVYTTPKAFLAGAALMLLFLTGAAMAWRGAARAHQRAVALEAARLATAVPAPADHTADTGPADGPTAAARPPAPGPDDTTGPTAPAPGRPTGSHHQWTGSRHWWKRAA